jgi:hypothetical protein
MKDIILKSLIVEKYFKDKKLVFKNINANGFCCDIYKDTNDNSNDFPKILGTLSGIETISNCNYIILMFLTSHTENSINIYYYKEIYSLVPLSCEITENNSFHLVTLNYLFSSSQKELNDITDKRNWLDNAMPNYYLSDFRLNTKNTYTISKDSIKPPIYVTSTRFHEVINNQRGWEYYPNQLIKNYLPNRISIEELLAQAKILDQSYEFYQKQLTK